jgi:demethylmenaquinone methyltransferase/2-methoxy-6-polyprenyl-1,4-benzoquinol methylase
MATNPTRSFYDRVSKVYDLLADGGEHRARERGLEVLAAAPGERVLELGFGTGHALVALAEAVGARGRVIGIDISEGMLSVATNRLADVGLADRVDLRCQEVPPIELDSGSVDAVFLSFTLELFPLERIPEVLSEVSRVLTPEGRIGVVAMATVAEDESESMLEKSYKWMHQHFPHIVDCQPIAAERHLREAGFMLEYEERISLFTMPVAVLVGRKSEAVSA